MQSVNNFIGGQWREPQGSSKTEIFNPANGKVLATTRHSSKEETEVAIKAAHDAFLHWRKVPVVDRVQPLFKLKTLLEAHVEDLAKSVTREHGKTLVEARGSVRRAIQMVETACGMPTLQMGDFSEDVAAGVDSQAVRKPLGVFAGIAPFNFPAMVPFWFWPFAIASGNTFVLKPSERVPLTAILVAELLEKTGLPKGVFNIVQGGKEVVDTLCTHPLVRGVSFVGSTPVAKHVYTLGCQSGKRVQALGGAKNFMVVLPDAVMDKAVSTALESIIGCAGERCLAGSVIIAVGDTTVKEVEQRISRLATDVSVGPGLEPTSQMGPLISQQAKERVIGLIESAEREGAKILVDGRKVPAHLQSSGGYFLCPTVITGVTPEMRVAKEEIFGPVVLIGKAQSLDEAIQWINENNYGNTTTLFTSSGAAARKFSYEVDPSMIGINIGVPAPMAYFSFGGCKDSFFGDVKAHGRASVDFFTDTKVTVTRWLGDSNIWATK